MTEQQLAAVVRGLAPAVKGLIAAAVEPLQAEIDRLKALEPRHGLDGAPGKDAPVVDLDDLARRAAALIPTPKDGTDGKDGIDGKDAPVVDEDDIVLRAAALIPTPKDGSDGQPGQPGPAGKDAPVPDLDEIATRAAALIPTPKDGRDGAAGMDGLGIREAFVTEEGALVLTMTDGSTKAAGRVVGAAGQNGLPGRTGKDGADGADGKDGLGFDDIVVEHDGERTFAIKFKRGDRVKDAGTFTVPAMIHRGIFTEGRIYDAGDVVTWAGSGWLAKVQTSARPGDGSPEWVLVIKRGRDGKDGKDAGVKR